MNGKKDSKSKGHSWKDDKEKQAHSFVCNCKDKQAGGAKQGEARLEDSKAQNGLTKEEQAKLIRCKNGCN